MTIELPLNKVTFFLGNNSMFWSRIAFILFYVEFYSEDDFHNAKLHKHVNQLTRVHIFITGYLLSLESEKNKIIKIKKIKFN